MDMTPVIFILTFTLPVVPASLVVSTSSNVTENVPNISCGQIECSRLGYEVCLLFLDFDDDHRCYDCEVFSDSCGEDNQLPGCHFFCSDYQTTQERQYVGLMALGGICMSAVVIGAVVLYMDRRHTCKKATQRLKQEYGRDVNTNRTTSPRSERGDKRRELTDSMCSSLGEVVVTGGSSSRPLSPATMPMNYNLQEQAAVNSTI